MAHLPLPLALQVHYDKINDGSQVGHRLQYLHKIGRLLRRHWRRVQPHLRTTASSHPAAAAFNRIPDACITSAVSLTGEPVMKIDVI